MDNLGIFFLIFGLSAKNNYLDFFMVFGAEYLIYFVFVLMFFFAIKGGFKEKKSLILSLICLPVAFIIVRLIHLFFFEPRPFISQNISALIPEKADASFPSRHAAIMAIISFSFAYFKSKWAPFFLFLMVWVGLARIYVGVHYPFDILGGIIVGIYSSVISLRIIKSLKIRFFS